MQSRLFIFMQYLLPQHTLSRVTGLLANAKFPPLKNLLIRLFIKKYKVDLTQAERSEIEAYESFNDFFTRALKPSSRTVDEDNAIVVSPADGSISQIGQIRDTSILQAKGHSFELDELIARNDLVEHYKEGSFTTIYLSPRDYHRVHMPLDGRLVSTTYIPGDLFSVNQTTAENVDKLFARNERLVCHFETELGLVAVILVGAMIVAGIETVWDGQVAPAKTRHIVHTSYDGELRLKKGDELGRFKLGSTVILLFQKHKAFWLDDMHEGKTLLMGQRIAKVLEANDQGKLF